MSGFPIGLFKRADPPAKSSPPPPPPPPSSPAPSPSAEPTSAAASSSSNETAKQTDGSGTPSSDQSVAYTPQAQPDSSPTYAVEPAKPVPASSVTSAPIAKAVPAATREISLPTFSSVRLKIAPIDLSGATELPVATATKDITIEPSAAPAQLAEPRAAYADTLHLLLAKQQPTITSRIVADL